MHISFCHNPTPHPYDWRFQNLTKYHFYISNDCKHDSELCNIVLSFIGVIWWSKDMFLIGFRVMVVHPNSKATNHDTLCLDIQIWLKVAKCYGIFLVAIMERDPMMGHELWSNNFFRDNNLMPKAKSCKMLKRWLYPHKNGFLIGMNHHILVLSILSIKLFGMLRLKMLVKYHLCSFVILWRGQWKSIRFVLLTKTTSFNYLLKIWHVFVSFVWMTIRQIANMFNGHAHGC
jgi:hypothetical protein